MRSYMRHIKRHVIMAKLSSASIRLVQKMNRQNRNGEFTIYIVACFSGRCEKATGVSCLPRYWDSRKEVIKGWNNKTLYLYLQEVM